MPRKPINYSKACIYKICCKDVEITDCYVGSTTNLSKRRHNHKDRCNNRKDKGYNTRVYQFIREHGGWLNWDVIAIEDYPCKNKQELETRERYWLEEIGATLNKGVPTLISGYKERITEYRAEYQQKNKERIKKQRFEYYEKNKERIYKRQAEYYEKNKERIYKRQAEYKRNNKERRAEYYQKNKEKMNEKATCMCGSSVSRAGKYQHERTKKHLKWLAEQEAPPPYTEEPEVFVYMI
jgi:hypothetical protein